MVAQHRRLTTALPRIKTSTFGATAHNRLPNSKTKIAARSTVLARAIVRTCENHKVNGACVRKKAEPIHPICWSASKRSAIFPRLGPLIGDVVSIHPQMGVQGPAHMIVKSKETRKMESSIDRYAIHRGRPFKYPSSSSLSVAPSATLASCFSLLSACR